MEYKLLLTIIYRTLTFKFIHRNDLIITSSITTHEQEEEGRMTITIRTGRQATERSPLFVFHFDCA